MKFSVTKAHHKFQKCVKSTDLIIVNLPISSGPSSKWKNKNFSADAISPTKPYVNNMFNVDENCNEMHIRYCSVLSLDNSL